MNKTSSTARDETVAAGNVPLYVVFDANIWFAELGLTTKQAAAVRFFLGRKNATVAIPEVVSLELKARLAEKFRTAKSQTERTQREILSILGSWQDVPLPSDEEIKAAIDALVDDIDVPNVHIPFSLLSARSSLNKVINKISPSQHKEEFRDGVIWADCIDLLDKGNVYFVTNDSAFYEHKKDQSSCDVASDLLPELSGHKNTLTLFRNLGQVLEEVRSDVDISEDAILQVVFQAEDEEISRIVRSKGFRFKGSANVQITPYITEKANQISFRFRIRQPCEDTTLEGQQAEDLSLSGEGFFDTATNTIDAKRLHVSNFGFDYRDADGRTFAMGSVRIKASLGAGHGKRQHTIRLPIERSEGDSS